MRTLYAVITCTIAVALATSFPSSLQAQASRLVVASGLDNPRGLAFDTDGSLWVAEAGRGGDSAICLPQPDAPPEAPPRCYGPTGAVTRVTGLGIQQRVATGLPSLAGPDGAGAIGPHDIGFGFGSAWVTVGFGGHPDDRAPLEAAGVHMGYLVQLLSNGQWMDVLDLSAHEAATNPDGGHVDSNPYALHMLPDGALFTDAGGNSLVKIAVTGQMSTVAVFPDRIVQGPFGPMPMQSVPTTIAPAGNGAFYVGELTGFPFPVGGASVYFVPPGGGAPTPVVSGFTNIIDIAVDGTGGGYVLEHDADGLLGPGAAGRLWRVDPFGGVTEITHADLTNPGGIAVGPDGAVYVTNYSTSPGMGEVVRIVP